MSTAYCLQLIISYKFRECDEKLTLNMKWNTPHIRDTLQIHMYNTKRFKMPTNFAMDYLWWMMYNATFSWLAPTYQHHNHRTVVQEDGKHILFWNFCFYLSIHQSLPDVTVGYLCPLPVQQLCSEASQSLHWRQISGNRTIISEALLKETILWTSVSRPSELCWPHQQPFLALQTILLLQPPFSKALCNTECI